MISRFTSRIGTSIAAVAAVAAGTCIGAPLASADPIPDCSVGVVTSGQQCTLAPGLSLNLIIKGGHGGAGGNGGAGGAGGDGDTGSQTVSGGAGGAGGAGGNGGAGAKWQGIYVNSTASPQILTFTIGANGAAGTSGNDGAAGTSNTGSGQADGEAGASGDGGSGGAGGEDSTVVISGITVAFAVGGDGGNGGNGGNGGQGGQSVGLTSNGTGGSTGSAGASGSGGNLTTTWLESPFIEIGSVFIADSADSTPPMWMQSYGRATGIQCLSDWSASWAEWANFGRGGDVCNRYIVWRNGAYVKTTDPEQGPFTSWEGK